MSSHEAYDPDSDFSRFLQTPPPLESQLLLTAPDDEPVPAAVQTSFDFPAPTNNEVAENQHQAPTMDVPPPPQVYGFPEDPVHAMIDPVPSLEALFDDIVLPNLENMSLFDEFMYDCRDHVEEPGNNNSGISNTAAEHTIEENINFVPFVRGQLDCSNCRSVRDLLHESANHKVCFVVHIAADPGALFQHAIYDRTYINADGQTVLNELLYVDLRQRTHEWVQNFVNNIVETLKNDTSGQLKDSCSTFGGATVCTSNITTPVANNNNDAHTQLELNMLKEIFSTPAHAAEVVAPEFAPGAPQQATQSINGGDILFDAGKWTGFSPPILECCQASVQDRASSANATDYKLHATKQQRKRISQFSMEDIIRLMHMNRKDAAKELNISSTSLKRLCRQNNTNRWPARKIIAINSKIKKLEEAAVRNVGTTGLLAIKEKLDKLKLEMAQLYASIMKSIQDSQKENDGAGPSGNNASSQ